MHVAMQEIPKCLRRTEEEECLGMSNDRPRPQPRKATRIEQADGEDGAEQR